MTIKDIQQALVQSTFDPGPVDGVAGPKTYAAVKAFQIAMRITADGVLRWETLSKLLMPEKGWATTLPGRAMQIASLLVGIREEEGPNHGVMVDVFLRDVGVDPGASWCMAFLVWCYDQAALSFGIANPLVHTGGVLDQLQRTKCKVILSADYTDPQPGDIGIIDLGQGHGHTYLVVAPDQPGYVDTVEGNTNDNGSADGIGTFARTRSIAKTKAFIRVS